MRGLRSIELACPCTKLLRKYSAPLILVCGFEVLSLSFSSLLGVSILIRRVITMQSWIFLKFAIMLTKAALTVVPCKMQGLHTPSLLPPVARASMYSQDNALLLFVSVQC